MYILDTWIALDPIFVHKPTSCIGIAVCASLPPIALSLSLPQFETADVPTPKGTIGGQQVEGFSAAFEHVAALNERGKALLGATPETQALVHEMLTYR